MATRTDVLDKALPGLELLQVECDRAVTELERLVFIPEDTTGAQETALDRLEYDLRAFYVQLCVVLEASELGGTRAELLTRWAALQGEPQGLQAFTVYPEYDSVISPALTYLRQVVSALRLLATSQESPVEKYLSDRFLQVLRDTGHLVHRRGVTPTKEHDVQTVMKDYLTVCFPGFVGEFDIPGVVKNFRPDGGLKSIHTAVEFKFAGTKEEVVRSLSGLFEDSAGYAGSHDWTRFISVVYMTEPFESEARFREDFGRAGMIHWTPILVTGPGHRKVSTRPKAET